MYTWLAWLAAVLIARWIWLFVRFRFTDHSKYYAGKHVWLVGASSGIGEELALQLGRMDACTLTLSSRRIEMLNELVQRITC